MKKRFFLQVLFLFQCVYCFSQTIDVVGNVLTIDTSTAVHPMVKAVTVSADLPAIQDTTIRNKVWVEPGSGSFFTDPLISINVTGKQGHKPLLLSTRIYDTSDIPPRTIASFNNMALVNTGALNSFTNILPKAGVRLTSNVSDIVPGDPMVFAITYKTFGINEVVKPSGRQDSTNYNPADKFKLYFFYNNNNTFSPINQVENLNGLPIPNIRTHNGEVPIFKSAIPSSINKVIGKLKFQNWFYYDVPNNNDFEKTVFVSTMPFANLELGKSGSVYAVLVNEQDIIVGIDSLVNMRFAPAHDPNYLVQQPFCLKLPKKDYPFNYTVHFQNTGAGDAKEVKILIHLPKGLNYNTIKVKKATFAGIDYTAKFLNIVSNPNFIIDRKVDTIKVVFDSSIVSTLLLGSASSTYPSTDEKTMGEILFTIIATPSVEDSLKAFAEIYFKSVHPSSKTIDGYEMPVKTNIAFTNYKVCCVCDSVVPIPAKPISPSNITPNNCYKILGLCWWWWIIIIVAILLIWWLLKRNKRDHKNEMPYKSQY